MTPRVLAGALFAVAVVVSPGALSQTPPPHPPMGTMPPGHGEGSRAAVNRSAPDPSLPVGTIAAQILDARGAARPNTRVQLRIRHDTVADGVREEEKVASSDASGNVTFGGLPTTSAYSFSVGVSQPPVRYSSPKFRLGSKSGHRVVLHVYEATSSIEDTLVACKALFHLEPRDDVFQVSVLLELLNLGGNTWVPNNTVFSLPEGWKAFNPQSDEGTVSVEASRDAINLVGSVNPGRHQLIFSFQIPRHDDASALLQFGLPPRMRAATVRMNSSSQMQLAVDGFPPAQPTSNNGNERLLRTQLQLPPSSRESIGALNIRISGLPTRGNQRWHALLIALAIAGLGVRTAWQSRKASKEELLAEDPHEARELLYSELLSLEHAFRRGKIGPETHGRARDTLLGALARLELLGDAKG